VAGDPPGDPDPDPGAVVDGLARLAEQSLLTVAASPSGTRYRALETIRQYGTEQLAGSGELADARARHLGWCLTTAQALAGEAAPATGDWRARFDATADDIRAALGRAADQPDHRTDARDLALSLAVLAFARNLAGEAQRRYEQAATLTGDPAAGAAALRRAADVAACRMQGDDTYRLRQDAAALAQQAGDTAAAARDLAGATTAYFRMSGVFAHLPPTDDAVALLIRARDLAEGAPDAGAQAAVALAECGALGDAFFAEEAEPKASIAETSALAERAVGLARGLDDPLAECAALDALTGAQHRAGDTFAAAATARRRVDLLHDVAPTPAATFERIDTLLMATETSIGVGDLTAARQTGQQLRDLPFLAEVGHFATSRLLVADALAGYAEDVIADSNRFLDAWARSGRPTAPSFGATAAAVALIHGLRGDSAARDHWLAVLDQLGVTPERRAGYMPTFDAVVLLHHGQASEALDRLGTESDDQNKWLTWIWLHWHLALRAEASVLAHHPDADGHLAEARTAVAGNALATAIVDRATVLRDADGPADTHAEQLAPIAAAFAATGCPYQQARTLSLARGDAAMVAAGTAALADLGLAPTATGSG
jgi:hypothetical protein